MHNCINAVFTINLLERRNTSLIDHIEAVVAQVDLVRREREMLERMRYDG